MARSQWSVGRTPAPGGGTGWQLRPFVSVNEFDVDIRERGTFMENARFKDNVKMQLVGIEGSLDFGSAIVSGTLATPDLEDDRSLGAESDGGAYFAIGARLPLLSKDKWSLGSSLELSALSTDVVSASTATASTATIGAADLAAIAADLSLTAAYTASSDALAAVSPYGGLGVRFIDGVQDFGATGNLEFDAVLAYTFVGLSLNWRPTEDLGFGIESHVLVGQINGFQLSFVASF